MLKMGKNKKSVNLPQIVAPQSSGIPVAAMKLQTEVTKKGGWDKTKAALAIMIKNEERRITVSFDSVKDYVDTFVILDTGSTDRTIEICRDYCQKNNIRLFLKEEPFVNFMVSRNVMLDYCDEVLRKPDGKPDQRYMILLDCNDELQNGEGLMDFIENYKGTATGFYLKQKWWTGNNFDSYFNIRMVKSHATWRYRGVVHEYIICEKLGEGGSMNGKDTERLEFAVLFQDRTLDDDKSFRRFNRDRELLYNEYIKDPHEPRTLFYLAQTLGCLSSLHEAYKFYVLRTKENGFIEEVYQSYFRLGEISGALGHPWEECLSWYLKAFQHSQRAEPLVKIAEHYKENNHFGEKKPDYLTAYMYLSMACKLAYPLNQILFVDSRTYWYKRWSLLGSIAFFVQRYKEGKEAAIKAIQAENSEEDLKNLSLYLRMDQEVKHQMLMGTPQFRCLTGIETDKTTILPDEEVKQTPQKVTREEALQKAMQLVLRQIKK